MEIGYMANRIYKRTSKICVGNESMLATKLIYSSI